MNRFTPVLFAVGVLVVLAILIAAGRPTPLTAGNETTTRETAGTKAAPSTPAVDSVQAFLTSYTGGTVPLEEATGEVREFVLEVHQVMRDIAPGVEVEQWAFALPGEEPSVPGPEIRVKEGDLVRITLVNTHDQPHTLHLHGITSVSQGMDGVPHTSHQLLPGQSYTYEFVAMEAGTHAYHCHVQTYLHMDMGMYGALIIEPREAEQVWDRDYTLVLDEWDSEQDPQAAVHDPQNNYYLINGKAFPDVNPISIPEGEVALVRLINMGYEAHAMHLHGMPFLIVAKDGHTLEQPYVGDTLPVLPGERYDLLVKGRDGDFPFHDHIVSGVTNGGVYPGGMHLMVEGGEARSVGGETPEKATHSHAEDAHAPNAHDHSDPAQHGAAAHEATTMLASAEPAGSANLLEGDVSVNITEFAFDQPVVTVKAGTTVTWVNKDAVPHTVTEGAPGKEAAFDSGMLAQGQSWSYTFSEPGEYDYYCLPHPFMTAKIVVVD